MPCYMFMCHLMNNFLSGYIASDSVHFEIWGWMGALWDSMVNRFGWKDFVSMSFHTTTLNNKNQWQSEHGINKRKRLYT